MNFVLRTLPSSGGAFRDEMLGPWKVIVHRGDPDFDNQFKLMFEEPPKTNEEYFCLVVCERGIIPVFVGSDAYIMSTSGETFEKIYTHQNHVNGEVLEAESSEEDTINRLHSMCEQSLNPELFENWMRIKDHLYAVRKDLIPLQHGT